MAVTSVTSGVPRELMQQNRMGRAGVTPASSVPRIKFSTGNARALADFSFDMFQASSRIEDGLDQQASAEGAVEGAADGSTGEFQVRDYTTIRDRAYNQAGIQTFVSTLETRSIFATANIRQQYANDPDGMRAALDQYHNGIAGELNGVSPGAGSDYLNRAAARTVPAVEAARDARFSLTRDQANAALIESQVALDAELTTHSENLFSDNPARSEAAADALQIVGQEMMRIYSAVDETTGRPLYSETERATAMAAFNERVFETASLSWFDQQEDPAQAYLDFTNGDFSFNIESPIMGDPSGRGWIDYSNQNATRDDPLSPELISAMDFLPAMGVRMEVISGGQESAAELRAEGQAQGLSGRALNDFVSSHRTGSNRHDHGNSADVDFYLANGTKLVPINPEHEAILSNIVRRARANGVTGFGEGSDYMGEGRVHLGFGTQAVWGAGGDVNNAPNWLTTAYNDQTPLMPLQTEAQSVPVTQNMSPQAVARVDAQMRQRITFANGLADRDQREQDRELDRRYEVGATVVTNAYLNGGVNGEPELSESMIQGMLERQEISYSTARQALHWMAEPAPEVSNQTVFEDLQRRMYAGDNIEGEVQGYLDQLSKADATSLLSRNQSLNSEGGMTEEQRGYLTMIRQTVAPEGMLASLDQGASMRAFNAQDEYRKRIAEGEDASTVAREIVDRAQRETVGFENSQTQRLLRPRFAVSLGTDGHIDVNQTATALEAARTAGTISEYSYRRQRDLIMQWARLQGDVN